MKSIFLYKIKKLAIRLPELAIILCFLSCHNPVAITEPKSADKAYLSIQIGGQERTVLPNSIDISDMTIAIAFEGTKNGSEEKLEYRWNPTATEPAYMQMRVDSSICIGTGTWNFTLKILQNENLILIGSINGKAIESGNNTLNFVLYPTDISGSGNVAMTLQFPSNAGVTKVDAGLYTREGTEVAGSKSNLDIGSASTGTSQVSYVKTDIASGTYLIQFNLYRNNGVLMNTYMELVTVVSECTSSAKCSLSSLNTLYTITYHNITGATWAENFTVPVLYNTDMSVTLPTKENIKLGNCIFLGWYENADFSGEPVSGWSPGRTGNAEFYARWGVGATADNMSKVIEGLSDSVVDTVVLTDAVDNGTINKIRNALMGNSDVKIYLDLSSVTGLKEMPIRGFESCVNLTGIALPDSLTTIGNNAFAWCGRLTGITLPNSLTTIGNNAFAWCGGLSSITIPKNVTEIGAYAFSECTDLKNVTFSDASGWYRTTNKEDWKNKVNGKSVALSDSKTAAEYLTSTYVDYYWYKKNITNTVIATDESAITTDESAIATDVPVIATDVPVITTDESVITTDESAITYVDDAFKGNIIDTVITTDESAIMYVDDASEENIAESAITPVEGGGLIYLEPSHF